ncbi:hypothetical protein ACFQ0T_25695 [Kitasatospora gansuensis]
MPSTAGEPPRTDRAEQPWSRNDALITGGACALNLLSYVFFDSPDSRYDVNAAGFLLLAVAALPLLARRSHPVAALAAVLALDATASLVAPLPGHFGAVLMVALYTVARTRPGRVTAVAAVTTVAVTLLSQSSGRIPSWGRPSARCSPPRSWSAAPWWSTTGSGSWRPTAGCSPTVRWPTNGGASHGSCTTSWPTTSPPCS